MTQPGYDVATKVYADFVPGEFPLLEPTKAAARAALGEFKHLQWEFRSASAGDEAAALSAMLTAAMRPSLPYPTDEAEASAA